MHSLPVMAMACSSSVLWLYIDVVIYGHEQAGEQM